jgi:hypothetical protein
MVISPGTFNPVKETQVPTYQAFPSIHSFHCNDSLLFSGATSIPLCYILFPATLLQLFFHPPSIHLKNFISAARSLVIYDLFHNHIIAPQFNVGMYLIRKNTYVWTVPYCSQHVSSQNLLSIINYKRDKDNVNYMYWSCCTRARLKN